MLFEFEIFDQSACASNWRINAGDPARHLWPPAACASADAIAMPVCEEMKAPASAINNRDQCLA
jgi:hypothetical protein